jgi:hypothetical protein
VGVRTIDTAGGHLDSLTTKLVVCVPELGQLIPSPACEVEDVGGEHERAVPLEQSLPGGLRDLSSVSSQQGKVRRSIANLKTLACHAASSNVSMPPAGF